MEILSFIQKWFCSSTFRPDWSITTRFPRKIKTCKDLLQLNFATCITGQKQLNLGVHQLVLVSACICKCLLCCLQAFGVQFLVHMDIHRWHHFLEATKLFFSIDSIQKTMGAQSLHFQIKKSCLQINDTTTSKHRYFCIINCLNRVSVLCKDYLEWVIDWKSKLKWYHYILPHCSSHCCLDQNKTEILMVNWITTNLWWNI